MPTTRPARRTHRRSAAALLVLCLAVLISGVGTSQVWADGPATPPAPVGPAVVNCPKTPGHVACLSIRQPISVPAGHSRAVTRMAVAPTAYSPADLAAAYRIPPSTSEQTIGIVDAYDAPTVEADLAVYRAQWGLPACTSLTNCFQKVNQSGSPAAASLPAPDADWARETTLDVEMVSAICPTCHILLVEADDDQLSNSNIERAVSMAVELGARYVSMSWGTDEVAAQRSLDKAYLSVPGVTYVAASGDGDYGTSWPAASSNVVSVGGTTLRRAAVPRGWQESVWGYTDGSGTGSGCSSQEPKPGYQLGISSTLCPRRALNDVSVLGDPNTGVAVYQDGSWWRFGGTSAGSPIIAAMYAMAGPASSTSSPSYPYAHRGAFNDITTNANAYCGTALCTAGPGWDGPSGVGSPVGLAGFAPIFSIAIHNPGTVTSYTAAHVALNVKAGDSGHLAVVLAATGLPAGTAVRADGWIVGAPKKPGSYVVTVRGRDARGSTGSTVFRWNVKNHTLVTTMQPHVSGALRRHAILTAVYGSFRQDSVRGALAHPAVHFRWYLDGRPIAGAVNRQFKIPNSYLHHRISVQISASEANFNPYLRGTARSAPIG